MPTLAHFYVPQQTYLADAVIILIVQMRKPSHLTGPRSHSEQPDFKAPSLIREQQLPLARVLRGMDVPNVTVFYSFRSTYHVNVDSVSWGPRKWLRGKEFLRSEILCAEMKSKFRFFKSQSRILFIRWFVHSSA